MTQQTALKINQGRLIHSLRFSFTNTTTVLGELMQNARRAGATKVEFEFTPESKTLVVRDDGCGIDSFQTLLTVAESGWDAEIIEKEHPFGIGFLSALFACEHITVESKGGRIATPTADILAFKPVDVSPPSRHSEPLRCPAEPRFEGGLRGCGSDNLSGPDEDGVRDCYGCGLSFTEESAAQAQPWNGVTTLILAGLSLDMHRMADRLEVLAKGFPIPVFFNGVELKRPWALDSREFVKTEVGGIYLMGLEKGKNWWVDTSKDVCIYLQGLPIYEHRPGFSGYNVVHLDSSKFHARLPDRDKLVDEDGVVRQVREAMQQAAESRLGFLKSTLPAAEFVKGYKALRIWNCLDLLNDVPIIPSQALASIDGYPIMEGCHAVNLEPAEQQITREEIESGKVVVAELDSFDDIGAPRWMYAWKKEFLVCEQPLDSGHWLHQYTMDLDSAPVSVEIVGEAHRAYFDGTWVCGEAVFCDKYRIIVDGDAVEIDGDSTYLEEDGVFAVPKGDASGRVVRQASSYFDENDSFNEAVKDEDEWTFEKFVVANTSATPANALERLLPSFAECPKVFGRRYALELDAQGRVRVEELADGRGPVGQTTEGKYLHDFDVAFCVRSDQAEWEDLAPSQVLAALKSRVEDLTEEAVFEAVGFLKTSAMD